MLVIAEPCPPRDTTATATALGEEKNMTLQRIGFVFSLFFFFLYFILMLRSCYILSSVEVSQVIGEQ